jgi:hypothetical protein
MKNRGERRARTKNTVKKRLKTGGLIFGLGQEEKAQPHRMAKHKPKFTGNRSSLKFLKQKANRAARRNAKLDIRAGKEEPDQKEGKNSVRWSYW